MKNYANQPQKQEEVDILEIVDTLEDFGYMIVVYNDEVNTFDWVIESLISVCNHTEEQATQCAMFVHYKGKYAVKHGSETELIPMKDALLDRGITASLESC